jgi:hypothetical protein
MKFPTQEQIGIAVQWLQCNEGEGEEAIACKAVAAWLDHEADERFLRSKAREAGVPLAVLRRRLNGMGQQR